MPKSDIKILSNSLNVLTRTFKYFGTSATNAMTIRFLVGASDFREGSLIACGVASGIAGSLEALNIRYNNSKRMKKTYKLLLKFERFLDFVMLFRMLYNTSYYVLNEQYAAISISGGITLPFACWRAHKTAGLRYLVENPISLFLAKNLKYVELHALPLPYPISNRFSEQSFSVFKRLQGVTDPENADRTNNAKMLLAYFNSEMVQHSFFNRYVLMDALSYGAEIASVISYTMFIIDGIFHVDHPIINFGLSLLFFVAGSLVGYDIEKKKNLLMNMYLSHFSRDQELQNGIHELLVDLYTKVTANVRRFAKIAEFFKNAFATFIGLMFAYTTFAYDNDEGQHKVDELYGIASVILAFLVGINSIYNVAFQQQKMLRETGALDAMENRRLTRQGQTLSTAKVEEVVDVDAEAAARKDVNGDQHLTPEGSLEGSAASSVSSDSPPIGSLPNDSPPRAITAARPNSVAGTMPPSEEPSANHHWYDFVGGFFFGNRNRHQLRSAVDNAALRERLIPAIPTAAATEAPPVVHYWYDSVVRFFGSRSRHHPAVSGNIASQNFVPVSAETSAQPVAAGV